MIALDLSRLLSHARDATPTGIDRVELAYARHLISGDAPYCFAARNAIGGIGLVPSAAGREFIAVLGARWRGDASSGQQRRATSFLPSLRWPPFFSERKLHATLCESGGTSIYLLVSHQNLDRAPAIERFKDATGARFICMIHDLIPLDFPQLTRPGQARRHERRVATVAALADAAIVNSAATRAALLDRLGRDPMAIAVAPLGIDLPRVEGELKVAQPYFVCIGTIEARKNHRLLIGLWQRLAGELSDRAPRLLIIGQRGFGAEKVSRDIEGLPNFVIEHAGLSDVAMTRLLAGARALLMPSFAEGYGLPVVEALAQGVPVLCSDLPALRECGAGIPDYLEPTDAEAWCRAILDYVTESPRRQAQLARLAEWRAPSWSAHFSIVERLIEGLG